jgi:hypothetical protein
MHVQKSAIANPKTLAWIAAVVALVGCAGGLTPQRLDEDVRLAFVSHAPPGEYRYYFLGWENMPYAIIGLDPQYTLTNRFWRPVEEADRPMGRLIDALYEAPANGPKGAYIVDPEGRTVGLWYSSSRLASFRVDPDTFEVSAFYDEPWINDGADGRRTSTGSIDSPGLEPAS